jgi:hypothetical protein
MLRPSMSRTTEGRSALTWANVHEFEKAAVPAAKLKNTRGAATSLLRPQEG